ncbi:HAD family hydrolase [Nocardia sp. NBC_01327]|uniref:HAD family hydrolase n=1 Tax=Nocardia sp. NBC_01327 TaxID=2903593 RepID=UPI002E1399D0|nr:HAD family phosphatase [Nocardia sp. NBC_01327]
MNAVAPRAIWFDFGGVLSPPLSDLFDAYEQKTGITPRALRAAMDAVGADLGAHPLAPIELAAITEYEWGSRLRTHLAAANPALDLSRAELEMFGGQWFSNIHCNSLMASTVRAMRAQGHLVGVLSNNVVEWEPHWHRMIEPAGELDALIDSCFVGVRKPDPRIFRIAEEALGVAPSDCLLIDDLAENCAAAEESGWQAIRFTSNDQTLRELSYRTGTYSVV